MPGELRSPGEGFASLGVRQACCPCAGGRFIPECQWRQLPRTQYHSGRNELARTWIDEDFEPDLAHVSDDAR